MVSFGLNEKLIVLSSVVFITAFLAVSYIAGGRVSQYFSPPYGFDAIPNLHGKIAIVTGSNGGIGYVTARELTRKGAHVIATARDEERGLNAVSEIKRELGATENCGTIEFRSLDMSSFKRIKLFTESLLLANVKIDILILNAAVVMPDFQLTEDSFELQIGTNYIGNFLLVRLLYPLLLKSGTRIVHVSSKSHESSYSEGIRFDSFRSNQGYNRVQAYGQSKLAVILFSNELARRFNGTGVTSNALHPGVVYTHSNRHVEAALSKSSILALLMPVLKLLFKAFSLDVDDGALTQLFVATSPTMENVTGKYFGPIAVEQSPSHHALNENLQKILWSETEKMLKPFLVEEEVAVV